MNMKRNETNYFTFYNLLKDMIVFKKFQTEINMSHILDLIKGVHSIKNIDFIINEEKFRLYIFYITEHKFSFQLENVIGYKLFRHPINYFHNGKKYQFISEEQFEYIIKKLFNCPVIKCKKTNSLFKANFCEFRFHVIQHNDKLIESFHYKVLEQKEFHLFFATKKNYFIRNTFESPEKFEKNFNYYFDFNNKLNINCPFFIYDDEYGNHKSFSDKLLKFQNNSNVKYYFGAPGIGKSITLLGNASLKIN